MTTSSTEQPPEATPPQRGPAAGGRFKDLPVWVQVVTAILGVVLAAIGVGLTAIQLQRDDPTASPIVLKSKAFIQQVEFDAGQVKASGRFENVDLAAEIVLFMSCAQDTGDKMCVPVQASVNAKTAAPGALVDGDWNATRPLVEKRGLTWWAVVVPNGIGVNDIFADIRRNGPNSIHVLAASDPFRTEDR